MHASIQAKSFFKTAEDDKFDLYEIDYDVKLAANIIDARLKRNMTQEELAQKLNTKQPAIARAENGDSPPSHKLLKKIARILRAKLQPATFELENDIIIMVTLVSHVLVIELQV